MPSNKIQEELSRLQGLTDGNRFLHDWLSSEFDDSTWVMEVGEHEPILVNFSVALNDGSTLTDIKNQPLLSQIKETLLQVGSPYNRKGALIGPRTVRMQLICALKLIDYFILRSEEFKIADCGFDLVAQADVKRLIHSLSTSAAPTATLYQWPGRLYGFLENTLLEIPADIPHAPSSKRDWHAIEECSDESAQRFAAECRNWLAENGYYKKISQTRTSLNTTELGKKLLPDCLWHPRKLFEPKPLRLTSDNAPRQMEVVPVRHQASTPISLPYYWRFVTVLSVFADHLFTDPSISGDKVRKYAKSLEHNATPVDRFKSLPTIVVWQALGDAIDFYFENSERLFAAYVAYCNQKKCFPGISANKAADAIIPAYFGPENGGLAPQHWKTPAGRSSVLSETPCIKSTESIAASLHGLLMVLFGAIHIIVGILSARRLSELIDLQPNTCLEPAGGYLVFENRKSGILDVREFGPIPSLVGKIVHDVKGFQKRLIEIGWIGSHQPLLAHPAARDIGLVTKGTLKNCKHLDYFCDYFETSTEKGSLRYHFRTHQFRRFFAMAFFWAGSDSRAESLSWFLAHTEPEMLYRYVSEDMPGQVLNSVKAQYVRELCDEDSEIKTKLAALVSDKFDCSTFALIPEDELDSYLERLLEEGDVEVEPQFYVDEHQNKYRICVIIHPAQPEIS